MKKLLLLGGSRYLIPVIMTAHKLGVHVITCDYLPENIAHKYSDEYYNISIVDREAVLNLARGLQVDGIMSFATDPGVIVAAYVAEQLGLPFCPYESVKILQNKDLFRKFLKENDFNVPLAMGFDSKKDAMNEINKFKFPIIVKPVDSAGSKGVTRVDNVMQLEDAISVALKYSISKRFIIEEFIVQKGCSSDSDCFSVDNKLMCASFSCQYFDKEAENPYTPAAYSWPSDMPQDIISELQSELQRLIRLLNLGTSIYNVETRMGEDGKPYIMEISPRGGGNRLSEMLKYAAGIDLIENNIRAALNMPLEEIGHPIYNGVWAEYIVHSEQAGAFSELMIEPEFEKNYIVEKDIWVKENDFVHAFTGANETLGTLVLKFENQSELSEKMKNIKKYIQVIVK